MKYFVLTILSLLSVHASADYAANKKAGLPEKLSCKAVTNDKAVKEFEIVGLNGDTPTVSIYDAELSSYRVDSGLVDLSFSNECDNSYDIVFFWYDLRRLQLKEVNKVQALMHYLNDTTEETTVVIECTN